MLPRLALGARDAFSTNLYCFCYELIAISDYLSLGFEFGLGRVGVRVRVYLRLMFTRGTNYSVYDMRYRILGYRDIYQYRHVGMGY